MTPTNLSIRPHSSRAVPSNGGRRTAIGLILAVGVLAWLVLPGVSRADTSGTSTWASEWQCKGVPAVTGEFCARIRGSFRWNWTGQPGSKRNRVISPTYSWESRVPRIPGLRVTVLSRKCLGRFTGAATSPQAEYQYQSCAMKLRVTSTRLPRTPVDLVIQLPSPAKTLKANGTSS